jgi:hypothetical protein
MSVAGLVLALLSVGAGLAPAGRSIAELLIGSLLTPLFILAGPGMFVAVALIAMIGLGTRRGFGRAYAIASAGIAGLIWLGIFLSPQLLSDPPQLPNPGVLVAIVPWLAYGLIARLAARPSARDIGER